MCFPKLFVYNITHEHFESIRIKLTDFTKHMGNKFVSLVPLVAAVVIIGEGLLPDSCGSGSNDF